MIKSMTAYAGTDVTSDKYTMGVEIRGYNSRHLDVAIKIHPRYGKLEEKIKKTIMDSVSRGRVEVKISIKETDDTEGIFSINESMASAFHSTLTELKNKFDLNSDISLDLLSSKHGIIEMTDTELNIEESWQVLENALIEAISQFDAMKTNEGKALAADLADRLTFIESCITKISDKTDGLLDRYQEKLKTRINSLTKGLVEIDPARIAQEAAFIADKSDISEELVRAESHLKQFRQLMDAAEPSGRPMNFLLQEFNREFNTMGSKAGDADIAHIIVSAKTELEKMREQVQNVE